MNAASKPEPSELWLALTALPRPGRNIPMPVYIPGSETPIGDVYCQVLTQEEVFAANASAERYVKELLKDPQKKDEANLGYQSLYANEVAVQVLFRACKDPKDPDHKSPAFPSTEQMRRHFSSDQLGVLWENYCTVQTELGPIRAHMSKEASEALILRLVEGGSAFPFDSISWEQQRAQVSFMASQIVSCWMAMSSAGLPLDVSSFVKDYLKDKAQPPKSEDEQE